MTSENAQLHGDSCRGGWFSPNATCIAIVEFTRFGGGLDMGIKPQSRARFEVDG